MGEVGDVIRVITDFGSYVTRGGLETEDLITNHVSFTSHLYILT